MTAISSSAARRSRGMRGGGTTAPTALPQAEAAAARPTVRRLAVFSRTQNAQVPQLCLFAALHVCLCAVAAVCRVAGLPVYRWCAEVHVCLFGPLPLALLAARRDIDVCQKRRHLSSNRTGPMR